MCGFGHQSLGEVAKESGIVLLTTLRVIGMGEGGGGG